MSDGSRGTSLCGVWRYYGSAISSFEMGCIPECLDLEVGD